MIESMYSGQTLSSLIESGGSKPLQHFSRLRYAFTAGITVVLLGFSMSGHADPTMLKLEPALKLLQKELDSEIKTAANADDLAAALKQKREVAEIIESVSVINTYLKDNDKTTFSVEAGVSGDETNHRNLVDGVEESVTINAGAELSRGIYPLQARLKIETQAKSRDGKFEEELSTMRASLDYYLPCKLFSEKRSWCKPRSNITSWGWEDTLDDVQKGVGIEIFGFAERFSDDFMSIDQRWEAGGGAKLEWSFLPVKLEPKPPATTNNTCSTLHEIDGVNKNRDEEATFYKCAADRTEAALNKNPTKERWAKIKKAKEESCKSKSKKDKSRCIFEELENDFSGTSTNPGPTRKAEAFCEAERQGRIEQCKIANAINGNPLQNKVERLEAFYESCKGRNSNSVHTINWQAFEKFIGKLDGSTKELTPARCEELVRQVLEVMKQQEARYEFGLSTALVVEAENPGTLKLRNADDFADDVATEFTPASDTRVRLSNRFSFRYRPIEQVTLDARYYWKLPLDKPVTYGPFVDEDKTVYRLSDEDKDIREEANIDLTYTLPGGKSSIVFAFDWYNDAGPPFAVASIPMGLPVDDLDCSTDAMGEVKCVIKARSNHRVFKMTLKHSF